MSKMWREKSISGPIMLSVKIHVSSTERKCARFILPNFIPISSMSSFLIMCSGYMLLWRQDAPLSYPYGDVKRNCSSYYSVCFFIIA